MMDGVSSACQEPRPHDWKNCHLRQCECGCHYAEAAAAIGEFIPLFMGPPEGRDLRVLYQMGMLISVSERTNEEEN
jgi:hypothetical protein